MVNVITFGNGRLANPLLMILSAASLFPIVLLGTCSAGKKQSNPFIIQSQLSSLDKAGTWLNSKPFTAEELKGKVVLIEFCTYTCINWIRTLPYVRTWDENYKDKGLVVIGVHTPEFPFETNIDNVRRSVTDMKVEFPIAVDNKYNIWNAFNNQYWPAIYPIDSQGRAVHHQFGEGGYQHTEKIIQQLLAEAGGKNIDHDPVPVTGNGVEAAADWGNLQSDENYPGYGRTRNFISPCGWTTGSNMYTAPLVLESNQWALAGKWTITKGSMILNRAGGKISCRFHARDLHLVMGPVMTGRIVHFRVLVDDSPPGAGHGTDIDDQGYGTLSEQRLYQLIRQTGSIIDHTFEIEFFDAGAEAFSFTFG